MALVQVSLAINFTPIYKGFKSSLTITHKNFVKFSMKLFSPKSCSWEGLNDDKNDVRLLY